MEEFNYNAPQYIDFTEPNAVDLENFGEDFFDIHNDANADDNDYNDETLDENFSKTPPSEVTLDDSFKTPYETPLLNKTPRNSDETEEHTRPSSRSLRRSMSTGHIEMIAKQVQDEALINLMESLNIKNNNGQQNQTLSSRHRATSFSRLSTKSRSYSRDAMNTTTTSTISSSNANKYVSLAEAIKSFHFKTPQRFHTTSAKSQFHSESNRHTTTHTIPQSPVLCTKNRTRLTSYVSRDKLECLEAEEMKKHQIKANPINYKIFKPPVINIPKKPATDILPFNFIEVKYKKPATSPKEVYQFHAQPAPKIHHQPIIKKQQKKPITVATTPTVMRRSRIEKVAVVSEKHSNKKEMVLLENVNLNHEGVYKSTTPGPKKTMPKPFSFEERNRKMLEKKEEKIKKYLEDEKKSREFHARPIPSVIAGPNGKVPSKVSQYIRETSSNSLLSHNEENVEPNINQDQKRFKARPATVIHKKPFVPKKTEHHTEITEFQLSSQRRAADRKEFDKHLKEKEEQTEHFKRMNLEQMRKVEELKIAQLRREIVHKANPVPQYKPMEIKRATKKLTSPHTPNIKSTRKRNNSLTIN